MAKRHAKNNYVSLNGVDISAYCNSCSWSRAVDSHDNTTFGNDNHVYGSGLGDGTVSLAGLYEDNTSVTGTPTSVLQAAMAAGTAVEFVHRPEGTGSGKPERTVDVIVTKYDETNEVADFIKFSAELQMSGDLAITEQT